MKNKLLLYCLPATCSRFSYEQHIQQGMTPETSAGLVAGSGMHTTGIKAQGLENTVHESGFASVDATLVPVSETHNHSIRYAGFVALPVKSVQRLEKTEKLEAGFVRLSYLNDEPSNQ